MSSFPLSPTQRRLVDRGRIDGRTTIVFETPEAKPLAHWRSRFDEAVERHEILRTAFEIPAGLKVPAQVIGERSDASLSVDGRTLTIELPAAAIDAWGVTLLARELAGEGRDDPMQYPDAGEWLAEVLEEEEGAEARAFWAERVSTTAPELFGPASGPGAELRHPLPALDDADRPAAAFLAAWASLARRLHGDEVPAFGVRLDGRFHEDLGDALGLFARLAPARLRVEPGDSFATLVDRADDELAELRDLEAQLDLPADAADPSVVVAFEDWRGLPTDWALVALRDGSLPAAATLVAAREEQGWVLRLRHAPELSAEHATRLAEQLASVLTSGLADPTLEALALPALPDGHRALLLEEWSPPMAPPEPARLEARFAAAAVEHPDTVAVIAGDRSLTYSELTARARQIAGALERAGVEAGQRVAISVRRSPDLLAALLGTAMRGATYVPLDPAYPAERVALLLDDCDAAHAIVDERDGRFASATVLGELGAPSEADGAPPSVGSVDDVAYVIYTSGSTGRPKGVEVTHRQLHASNDARRRHYRGGPGTFLLLSSVAFDSSVAGIVWTLTSGGTLVLPAEGEERDPDALAARVQTHEVTTLLTLPSLHGLLLERSEALASLRCAIVAGEACPRALVVSHGETLGDCALHNEYGPTEGTVWSTVWRATQPPPARIPIGRPIAHARAYVVDERGALAPIGAAGELWVGGAGVAKGYLGDPERTAERFGDDPFGEGGRIYRTGDRVRWVDGELEFLGRVDDQVKVRGFRVELGEVEAALTDLDGVREAAATVRGEGGSARLVGYLVHEGELDTEALRAALSERLPAYMVPTLVTVGSLPRTPNGKVDRDALPAPESLGRSTSTPFVAPRDPVEEVMAGLWQQVLGADELGVHDDFFELGGTSLLVTQVVARVRQAFRVELPLRMLFDHPTVESFVGALRADPSRAATMKRLAPLLLELARRSLDEASEVVARHGRAE